MEKTIAQQAYDLIGTMKEEKELFHFLRSGIKSKPKYEELPRTLKCFYQIRKYTFKDGSAFFLGRHEPNHGFYVFDII